MVHPKAKNLILAFKHIIVCARIFKRVGSTGCFETEARYSAPRFGTAYACRTKQIALDHTHTFHAARHYSMLLQKAFFPRIHYHVIRHQNTVQKNRIQSAKSSCLQAKRSSPYATYSPCFQTTRTPSPFSFPLIHIRHPQYEASSRSYTEIVAH